MNRLTGDDHHPGRPEKPVLVSVAGELHVHYGTWREGRVGRGANCFVLFRIEGLTEGFDPLDAMAG